jgi:hypothetical protein
MLILDKLAALEDMVGRSKVKGKSPSAVSPGPNGLKAKKDHLEPDLWMCP